MSPTSKSPDPLAVRPSDAAKILGISTRTLWELSSPRGSIPCIRIGTGKRRPVLYLVDELRAWLNRQSENSGAAR